MNFTLTLGETCILFLAIALFILLLYCISLIRHLIPSIKSLSKVMKNVETITDSAANSTKSAETVVNDVVDITSSLVTSIKNRTSLLGQISSIAIAVKSVLSLLTDKDDDISKDVSLNNEEEESTKID